MGGDRLPVGPGVARMLVCVDGGGDGGLPSTRVASFSLVPNNGLTILNWQFLQRKRTGPHMDVKRHKLILLRTLEI